MDYDILGLKVGLQFDEKASLKNLRQKLNEIQRGLKESLNVEITGIQQAVVDLKGLDESMKVLSNTFRTAFSAIDMGGLAKAMDTINKIDASVFKKATVQTENETKKQISELERYKKSLSDLDNKYKNIAESAKNLDTSLKGVASLIKQVDKVGDTKLSVDREEMDSKGLNSYEQKVQKVSEAYNTVLERQKRSQEIEKELISIQGQHLKLLKDIERSASGSAVQKEYERQASIVKEKLDVIKDTIKNESLMTDNIKKANTEYTTQLSNMNKMSQAKEKDRANTEKAQKELESLKLVEEKVKSIIKCYDDYKKKLSSVNDELKTGTGVNRSFTDFEKAVKKISETDVGKIQSSSLKRAEELAENLGVKYEVLNQKQAKSEEIYSKINRELKEQVGLLGKMSSSSTGSNVMGEYSTRLSSSKELVASLKEQGEKDGLITKEMKEQIQLNEKLVEGAERLRQLKLQDQNEKAISKEQDSLKNTVSSLTSEYQKLSREANKVEGTIREQNKEYNDTLVLIENIRKNLIIENSGMLNPVAVQEYAKEIQKLSTCVDELKNTQGQKSSSANEYANQLKELYTQYNKYNKVVNSRNNNEKNFIDGETESIRLKIEALKDEISQNGLWNKSIEDIIAKYEEQIKVKNKLNASVSQDRQITEATRLKAQYDNLGVAIKKLENRFDVFRSKTSSTFETSAVEELQMKIQALVSQFKALDANDSAGMAELQSSLKEASKEFGIIETKVKVFNNQLTKTSSLTSKIFLGNLFAEMAMLPAQSLRNAINAVNELDGALNDLRITMDVTERDLDKLITGIRESAIKLGTTYDEIMEISKVYANANESVQSIMQKIEPTAILATVSGIGAEKATTTVQAVLNQFSTLEGELIEKTTRIADVFVSVSRSLAMDFGKGIYEMAEAIAQSGSVADQAGINFEEYIAMLSSSMEVTRLAGSQIGNAFKTIFSRMGRVDDSSVLLETETTTENINDMEEALDNLGIKLRDVTTGDFRDTSDVLEELSAKWKGMSKAEQSYIAELGAGIRQKNIFLALMESMSGEAERYSKLLESAVEAEGASADAQEVYMDSLEAKMNMLKATTTEMWQSLIDSQLIGSFIKALQVLVDSVTKVANGISSLGDNALPIIVASSLAFTTLGSSVGGIIGKIASLKMGFSEIKGNVKSLAFGIGEATVEMNKLSKDGVGAINAIRGLSSALAGIGVGLAISFVVSMIQKIANKSKEAKDRFLELVDAINEKSSNIKNVEKLVNEQKELTDVLKKGEGTADDLRYAMERLEEVEKDIAGILPGSTTAWDEYGNAKADNITKNEELIASEKEALKAKLENVAIGGKAEAQKAEEALKASVKKSESIKKEIEEQEKLLASYKKNKENEIGYDYDHTSDKMIASVEARLKKLREQLTEHGDKIEENEKLVNDYNNAINDLNGKFGTSYQLCSNLSDIYKELNTANNELKNSTEAKIEALEKEEEVTKMIEESTRSYLETIKDRTGTYDEALQSLEKITERTEAYRAILKDLTDSEGNFDPDAYLSAGTVQDILKNHQELVGYLGDEEALYNYMVESLQRFGEEAGKAYQVMMYNSESYFTQNVKNTGQWEAYVINVMNNLKKINADYYNKNASGMRTELLNAKSLAKARASLETQCAKAIAEVWRKYYDKLDQVQSSKMFVSGREKFDIMKDAVNEVNALKKAYADLIADLDRIPGNIDVPNNIMDVFSSTTGKPTSSSDQNKVEDLELQIDRYYKLQKAIDDVTHALDLNALAQETATGKQKIKLIEEEIALLQKQKKAYEDLRAEQTRERNEKRNSISGYGFKVDANNQITNYNQRLKELENWANSASGDEKKQRQDKVKDIKELVDAFIELNKSIQESDSTIAGFTSQIQENREEMKDYYNDLLDQVKSVEDKITEALEKEIEKRRKAIEDEYDLRIKTLEKTKELYNKQNEEEDYKNELAIEKNKLAELQNAINVAMRDTSNAGKARLAELQKQYQEQQSNIENMIRDHERDNANERFDKEIDEAEEQRDKALESFDAKYDEKAIAQMVTELIANGWTQIGDEIIDCENLYKDFEDTFGEGMTILGQKIKEEFIDSLKEAQEILKNMGDIYSRLGLTTPYNSPGVQNGRSAVISSYSLGGSDAQGEASTPMMARATTNPYLAQDSISRTVSSRANLLDRISVSGDTISTINVAFESLVNVQGNVMEDLVPKLNDVVQRAVKEMDKNLSNNLKSRLGQL